MANLIGREILSNDIKQTQVYLATHDGVGNSLPYMSRSFISFTYGGKAIEDFGLIVTYGGDRLEQDAYASFSDSIETYETFNGQIYWGSHFEAGKLELTLATDSMTEQQLNDFKEWFQPGKIRELILSERPNRAILARISAAPSLSILPFEEKTSIKIKGIDYQTSTSIYKGEIKLAFVMDEPYWKAKLNYMPSYVNKKTLEKLEESDINPYKIFTQEDKDMLKIMLEDGIPHQSLLNETMFLGGNILVQAGAIVGQSNVNHARLGLISLESEGLSVNSGSPKYLFYSGTAPCKPIIKFTMPLTFDSYGYISHPRNTIENFSLSEYSFFQVGDKVLKFTTPSLLTGYNQAIQIFSESLDKPLIDILDLIKVNINERFSRAWAVGCLKKNSNLSVNLSSSILTNLKTNMRKLFEENAFVTFTIDSKTGKAIGDFKIRVSSSKEIDINSNPIPIKENVGDMICSEYLTIEGRNYLNSNGEISLENCKKIISNEELTNVLVLFDNMYL